MTRVGTGALLLALGLVAAACGSDADRAASSAATSASAATPGPAPADGLLAADCPATIVVQTDWFPEAEHGALYQLLGDVPEIDAADKAVRGPLVAAGTDTGVQLEIRTGGPAIGGQQVVSAMKQDPDILLGYVATDEAIENYAKIPTTAVVAPLEINPQIIMWDPQTYPDVGEIADLRDRGVTIRYRDSIAYMSYLLAEGIVDASQLDGSYNGSPAPFVAAGGAIAQQGFASSEPYTYEVLLPQWGRPVEFQLIHDTGWTSYAAPLAVLSERLDGARPCLERLVPMIQQAQVDYVTDPARTNALIVDVVEQYADFWVYSEDLAAFSVAQQVDLGLVGNGGDATLGNFDLERLEAFVAVALPVFAANDPPADLAPADIVTNEFIDPSIGL